MSFFFPFLNLLTTIYIDSVRLPPLSRLYYDVAILVPPFSLFFNSKTTSCHGNIIVVINMSGKSLTVGPSIRR